jgi:DNA gyrase/topoisomerase IV subunit A
MAGRRFFYGAVLIAALAIIAALWGMQLEANRHLREQSESSRQLLSRLAFLEVDNNRLSNIVAQANTPLAEEQLNELSKLRDEVRRLRNRTNDLQTMRTELRRLRTQLSLARSTMTTNAPPDVPASDIFPRDSWKLAGYDTPENAVESVTWAISQGDEDGYLDSLSPDLQDEMESELADGSFGDIGPLEMKGATGFRIVDRETISDDRQIITIYLDGPNEETSLPLVNTPDGWRVDSNNSGD